METSDPTGNFSTALHYNSILHCTTLHCSTELHYRAALHYTALTTVHLKGRVGSGRPSDPCGAVDHGHVVTGRLRAELGGICDM